MSYLVDKIKWLKRTNKIFFFEQTNVFNIHQKLNINHKWIDRNWQFDSDSVSAEIIGLTNWKIRRKKKKNDAKFLKMITKGKDFCIVSSYRLDHFWIVEAIDYIMHNSNCSFSLELNKIAAWELVKIISGSISEIW